MLTVKTIFLPEQNVRLLAVIVADWLLYPLCGLHNLHYLAMDHAQVCRRLPDMTCLSYHFFDALLVELIL